MSADLLFQICNNGVIPAWLLLLVAPHWRWTERVVHAVWIPLLLALAYVAAFAGSNAASDASMFTLEGVMALFDDPFVTLAGWIHYLAFDLFVGAWEVRDARRRGIRHAFVVPCLLATLMLGPLGLALYLVLRLALVRETSLAEAAA